MASGPVDAGRSPHAVLRPLPLGGARIEAGFWAERQRLCRDVLLPDGARRLEEAGNFDNLRIAAGRREGAFRGFPFMDSDVYKWLEALGWELGRQPSAALEALAGAAIDLIAGAQEESGYLNSYYQVARPGERFSNLSWDHELYCLGHLIQAGLAHARARADDRLVGVARRFADHVDGIFGPGARDGVPGHPEVETALVELYRHTGEERYLNLAQFFVDGRGRRTLPDARFGSSYWQDHAPVREAAEITGHAVRALYLAAGVTDLYLERGEPALLAAMERWWADMAGRKAYLTGAVGAHHADEAFGDAYELPPDRCYGETCAAIASVQWNWRMLLATGDARFADLLERTLYNAFLAGLALDGSGYSYVNPLHVRGEHNLRRPWFACACCPPNVMRLLASVHDYLATADGEGLQIHNYASSELRAGPAAVRVRTEYPHGGRVAVEVLEDRGEPWTLSLRVPAWSRCARVQAADDPWVDAAPGYVRLRRTWRRGDEVVLELDMTPRLVAPHPRIDAVRGCLAIERGPLVYCLEQPDAADGVAVEDLCVAAGGPLHDAPDPVGGVVAVAAAGRHVPLAPAPPGTWPYPRLAGGREHHTGSAETLLAVPYFAWGNRGPGAMRVWIPAAAAGPPRRAGAAVLPFRREMVQGVSNTGLEVAMEGSVARMVIDPAFTVGEVDERVFGSFVEHMGRAVYGGIYEPGHPTADADGFRGDVLELTRELGVTLVRYPGGNFVSAYDWEDGVGPRARRPTRLDLAWRSIEPNEIGTDEFMVWAGRAGVEPMLAVNLGTRGVDAARNLVEYCNAPEGSRYADWRAANGHADPYGIRLWCLGNEMDGPWQIGQKTAFEYGRLAAEAGKAMRLVDPSIELCVVGSSNSAMPTFGAWEDTVLDLAWESADYVSLHTYYDPADYAGLDAYLACSLDLDRMIGTIVATADAVAGRKRSRKRVGLSVDEWNVWHQRANPHHTDVTGPFKDKPPLAEDDHTVADALVVGCLLITLLRHADRVKVGCLAQLVNVIPPMRTLDGGPAWRQTSFFPFMHAARWGRGTVLRTDPDGPTYDVAGEGAVPALEATAVLDAAGGGLTLFAVNRAAAPLALDVRLRDLDGVALAEHVVLADDDLDAMNTAERPDRVTPAPGIGATVDGGRLRAELAPRSWNVLRLSGGTLGAAA